MVAQQIQQISLAIKRRVEKFVFEETEIKLVLSSVLRLVHCGSALGDSQGGLPETEAHSHKLGSSKDLAEGSGP